MMEINKLECCDNILDGISERLMNNVQLAGVVFGACRYEMGNQESL